jgi:lipoic acid synthetase
VLAWRAIDTPVLKPKWLRVQAAGGENYERLRESVRSLGLATVCEEAKCPNIGIPRVE